MGSSYLSEDVEAIASLFAERGSGEDKAMHGAERVDIQLLGRGNGPWRARKGDFEFIIDEPPARAGIDAGPNPLAYFTAGAASCFLSHLMMFSIDGDVVYGSVRLAARGYFDRRLQGGSFTRFVYDLKIESDETADVVREVVGKAEKACYAHNTLARAGIELTINLDLNGERVAELVADTDHLPDSVPRAAV